MAVPLSVPNVTSLDDERVVPPSNTIYVSREVLSSRELFEKYKQRHPDILAKWNIDESNYVRKPQGTGDYEGLWEPPYPNDIWDYWVNYRFSPGADRLYVPSTSPRYIPNIRNIEPFIEPFVPGGYVYNPNLLYLWDFIYNPETLTGRRFGSTRMPSRRREFPTYKEDGSISDESPIIPPYLPDATFPPEMEETYPWAAWEISIDFSVAQMQGDLRVPMHAVRALSQRLIRAHGASKLIKEKSSDAYRFTPHDSTETLGRVVRPLYPIQTATLYPGYYAVPYSPLVLRDVKPFTSNGWILCYRQALRYATSAFFPKNRLWPAFIRAARLYYGKEDLRMTVDYATLKAMPQEARQIWSNFDLRLFEPPMVTPIPTEKEGTQEAEDFIAVRNALEQALRNRDIYELATTVEGPLMEREPFLVITVQVRESQPALRQIVNFDAAGRFIITVPPLLSVERPLELDYYRTDQALSWRVKSQDVAPTIRFDVADVASAHQIEVQADRYGELEIFCDVIHTLNKSVQAFATQYNFKLSWLKFNSAVLFLDHGKLNLPLDVRDSVDYRSRNYAVSQISNDVLFSYADDDAYTTTYIADTWPLHEISSSWNEMAREELVLSVDFTRPVVLLRDLDSRGNFYLLVIKLLPVKIEIVSFGEQVSLQLKYERSGNYVTWKNPQQQTLSVGETALLKFHAVLPRHLGVYTAEIRQQGATGMPEYVVPFSVELKWTTNVPYAYIQRFSRIEFEQMGSWAASNPAISYERIKTIDRDFYAVCDLRSAYKGVFFRKMINAWAYNYLVDLENYAQCFPYVLEYCKCMDELVDGINRERTREVRIIDRMDANIRQFLPNYLSEPILNLLLRATDADGADGHFAYVIFDPLHGRWINVMALYPYAAPVNPSWLPRVTSWSTGLYERIQRVFPRIAAELQFKQLDQERAVSEVPTERWQDIRADYDDSRDKVDSLYREMNEFSNNLAVQVRDKRKALEAEHDSFTRQAVNLIRRRIIVENSAELEKRIRAVDNYIRFVASVVTSCIRVDADAFGDAGATKDIPVWALRRPGTALVWRLCYTNTNDFREVWNIISKDPRVRLAELHPMCVTLIGFGESVDQESTLMFQLNRRKMLYDEEYVVASLISNLLDSLEQSERTDRWRVMITPYLEKVE